jgi:hypothetical protein
MNKYNYIIGFILIVTNLNLVGSSYNSLGQTGLITLPSAEVHEEQSIYLTFNRSNFTKQGTITVTPFSWLEASYFYYRPDDLLWGGVRGLYLDKGFNVKFSHKPKSILLPRIAIGLDDFAGTGQFTKEYIATTYSLNNIKLTTGLGWGKFVGDSGIRNPLSIFDNRFSQRGTSSDNYNLGGSLSYDLWFRGKATFFGGIELSVPHIKDLTFKLENNPFDYFKFSCCGEGLSDESYKVRTKEADYNYGISYKYKDYGNIDLSYIKGNSWNLSFSIGFSAKKNHRKKNKFNPKIANSNYQQQTKKNEFYLDLLENLNNNKLYLQTANLSEKSLNITIDPAEHINPIISSSRAAYISHEILKYNKFNIKKIEVGHLVRGIKLNSIAYNSSDLDLADRYPDVLIKKNSNIKNPDPISHRSHEFKPKVKFPVVINSISPDFRTHVGSPERFLYWGLGIKINSEIQLNRGLVFNTTIGKSLIDSFDEKTSNPNTQLPPVRTQVVDFLQQSSKDFYISNLDLEYIWPIRKNLYSKISLGFLEPMYGGVASEILYKPFNKNYAASIEFNNVKKRAFDQKFNFQNYKVQTSRFNAAYYYSKMNILAKWSYGTYLAKDRGYTFDISRRMPSGWKAGVWFSNTNVSAEQFGEGSFDKGFYFSVPLNIFSKGYSKNVTGFSLRTMTRDGGQQLELRNRLIDSFYGSSLIEINENWTNYLD